jgi:hypothetical protein
MPDKSNKSNRERKKERKNNNNNNNIYSSKHIRIKEKELSKEKENFFLI